MTIERKVGMGIAGQPSGAVTVADVFSTHLYTGNSTARSINNGIDLDGEGGMVWIKSRSTGTWHKISDTERGANKLLHSNETDGESTVANTTTSFNSNGFSLGAGGSGNANDVNTNGRTYASWTFRKAPRFFDMVKYTGNGVAGHEIAHDLGVVPGMMIIKRLDGSGWNWIVYHRSYDSPVGHYLKLNTTNSIAGGNYFNSTLPTYSAFYLSNGGGYPEVNASGGEYVAYLFADNSAEDADEQMIKCGSFTGTGSDLDVNLGWEPQFLLIKNSTSAADWYILDTMRGFTSTTLSNELVNPNSAGAASKVGNVVYDQYLTSTGFRMLANASQFNASGQTYIYMAIRAPMMVEPSAGTEVFAVSSRKAADPDFYSGFAADMGMKSGVTTTDTNTIGSRLQGTRIMATESTGGESAWTYGTWDFMDGWSYGSGAGTTTIGWMWKRAKGYMDCVAYSGSGVAGRTVAHSLGVVPEMMWVKKRAGSGTWFVYHSNIGNTNYLQLNDVSVSDGATKWNNTTPTDTYFTLDGSSDVNGSYQGDYIAYLFASVSGVSKVGSYTGNGSSQTINCGFAAGARFILIKRTNASGDWYIWDTTRGIVAGNDPHLSLNTTAAQVTSDDSIDPDNSGFIVNQVSATNINVSSASYIFYAIA